MPRQPLHTIPIINLKENLESNIPLPMFDLGIGIP
jgi:hypothetical protein